jgi:hypothetical protein
VQATWITRHATKPKAWKVEFAKTFIEGSI